MGIRRWIVQSVTSMRPELASLLLTTTLHQREDVSSIQDRETIRALTDRSGSLVVPTFAKTLPPFRTSTLRKQKDFEPQQI
ncbi:hypothetical protein TNCV_1929221 [Trichonephila clavipes]|nr:hypothetical protein TNCV_1929221 [Trichonephila clavipes]